jgi:tetratricopeptide (TPR) repeat protein
LNPRHEFALHGKGNVLADMGRYDDALIEYEKVLKINP